MNVVEPFNGNTIVSMDWKLASEHEMPPTLTRWAVA
jgi:hypothetical protein